MKMEAFRRDQASMITPRSELAYVGSVGLFGQYFKNNIRDVAKSVSVCVANGLESQRRRSHVHARRHSSFSCRKPIYRRIFEVRCEQTSSGRGGEIVSEPLTKGNPPASEVRNHSSALPAVQIPPQLQRDVNGGSTNPPNNGNGNRGDRWGDDSEDEDEDRDYDDWQEASNIDDEPWADRHHKISLEEAQAPRSKLFTKTSLDNVLSELNVTLESLPHDMVVAYETRGIAPETLKLFATLEASALMRFFLRLHSGFRERLLADPKFLYRLMVAEVVMTTSRVAAEVQKRKESFWKDMPFVASNVANGVISQFFLIWVLAPTQIDSLPNLRLECYRSPTGFIQSRLDELPSFVFQKSLPGCKPFTILDRVLGFIYKAGVFGVIGLLSGAGGAAVTHGLVALKRISDPQYATDRPLPSILNSGLAYSLFCCFSSTPRYHTVNGIEALIDQWLGQSNPLSYFGVIALRWANNAYGGLQWVDITRWLSIEKSSDTSESDIDCQVWPIYPFILHLTCHPKHPRKEITAE
mmetsp:Transcript_7097/g.11672  ORF Transcript_7097/g.11672 Transcript_7097/m.11672 type:complete len:524 (-) Transcript_7097:49-1620(-)